MNLCGICVAVSAGASRASGQSQESIPQHVVAEACLRPHVLSAIGIWLMRSRQRVDWRGRRWGAFEHHAQEGQAGNRRFFVGIIYCCPSLKVTCAIKTFNKTGICKYKQVNITPSRDDPFGVSFPVGMSIAWHPGVPGRFRMPHAVCVTCAVATAPGAPVLKSLMRWGGIAFPGLFAQERAEQRAPCCVGFPGSQTWA